LSRLFNRQSAKEAKLDDPAALGIDPGQNFERVIEREQIHGLFLRDPGGTRERNLKLLGERREVLVEKPARRGGLLQTRTRDFKIVMIPGDVSLIGKYLNVQLTGTTGSTFLGQVVGQRAALPLAV
jgi:tRNA A37 methylthiotransferase MiaB